MQPSSASDRATSLTDVRRTASIWARKCWVPQRPREVGAAQRTGAHRSSATLPLPRAARRTTGRPEAREAAVTGSERGLTPLTRTALGELGRLLLAGENTQSVLQKVVDLLQRVLPDDAAASITLVRDQQATTAAYAGALAAELDDAQYEQGHGPCLDA